jgi:hypothetical protein
MAAARASLFLSGLPAGGVLVRHAWNKPFWLDGECEIARRVRVIRASSRKPIAAKLFSDGRRRGAYCLKPGL